MLGQFSKKHKLQITLINKKKEINIMNKNTYTRNQIKKLFKIKLRSTISSLDFYRLNNVTVTRENNTFKIIPILQGELIRYRVKTI